MTQAKIFPKQLLASFVLLIGLFLAAGSAFAETASDKQAQLNAMYAELLNDPTDTDKTIAYAELATEMGDYEAAIPPLERLLITNPDVPKLKLELGILYYLLGSYDMAKTYLQEVKQANTAPELIQQADEYLQKM